MSEQPEKLYRIYRFYNDYKLLAVLVKDNVTLEEAQEHCRREDTHVEGEWFDGYSETYI